MAQEQLAYFENGMLRYSYSVDSEGEVAFSFNTLAEVGEPFQQYFKDEIARRGLIVEFGRDLPDQPHVADFVTGGIPVNFEVTLPGFNGGTDETDDLVLWIGASMQLDELKSRLIQEGIINDQAILSYLPVFYEADFYLPAEIEAIKTRVQALAKQGG